MVGKEDRNNKKDAKGCSDTFVYLVLQIFTVCTNMMCHVK